MAAKEKVSFVYSGPCGVSLRSRLGWRGAPRWQPSSPRAIRRSTPCRMFSSPKKDDQAPQGAVRRVLLKDVNVPFIAEKRPLKSGYLVAAGAAALFGGSSLAIIFLAYVSLSNFLDAPIFLAALASAMTSLLVELFRVNFLSAIGSGGASGDFLLGLLMFSLVLGIQYGVDSDATLDISDIRPSKEEPSASSATPRRRRDSLAYDEKLLARETEAEDEEEKDDDEAKKRVENDLRQWDEKFINRALQDTQEPR